ncbi:MULTISPECIES: alpha/beta fold hydrolase [Rhodococcus]|jgi:pimeloyl-ACP methyl ester carboxylesterase|uniref:Alpha/beta hydrolase n=1 Tax=Rhodococcus cercidiphylli TaxID=489916 RepID=A0ABU4AV61_9NOCA|nr:MULTISPECIES: alpha/beta hydrolase [Rhodococcus]MDV6230126.1 alpha/beta hydrolase [Rhodococcus cercidiphylli]MDV8057872.1 alpha/beta hydrolase [Rhodococcus sp. IEGM 1343]RMB76706.1 alpha/beta hydrolase [Rhodococcus sp. SBT000017]
MNVRAASTRRRYLKITAGALTVGALALAFALRSPSPVGHWNSAASEDRFLAAYDRAFEDLPNPAETLDIRTDYGVVRVYRFDGTGTSTHPLLLLPGRSSGTPVWAANLPGLLTIGDVYTVDLLGEPGRSIQERPISSDEDQAAWLDQTLEALPADQVHLVGLSIGGWTATNLAVHDSTHLATLTLIDPAQTFADIPWGTAIRALPAAVPWLPKSWRDSFNSYTAGDAEVQDVPIADMIEAGMQGYSLKLPQPTRITDKELATLDVPVLAIIAGRSVMHDAEEAATTAERTLPDGTVHLYPDASHAINGEYPDRLRDDVAAFVAKNS